MVVVAALGNVAPLRDAARERRAAFDAVRAELAALEIVRDRAPADFKPTGQVQIEAGTYLESIDDIGSSPAYSEAELAARVEPVRARADVVMLTALGIAPQPGAAAQAGSPPAVDAAVGGAATARGPCIVFQAAPNSALDLTVPASGLHVSGRGPIEIRLRRFGDGWPPDANATIEPKAPVLRIPPDRSKRPWHARISASEPVTACTAG
jgi:hypothetical protein